MALLFPWYPPLIMHLFKLWFFEYLSIILKEQYLVT